VKPLPVPSEYQPLHKYLAGRYADALVLTFAQMEDLLGFPLPAAAREAAWWANDEATGLHSRAWTQAARTAVPNLGASIVLFDRLAESRNLNL
jgi:hypothetical protein